MCGRFTVAVSYEELKSYVNDVFAIDLLDHDFTLPGYNVAPGEQVIAVIHDGKGYRLGPLTWGFNAGWSANQTSIRPINARSETINAKPLFRKAYENHRCVILADGFYEWKKSRDTKIPYRFVMKDTRLFAMAGLYAVAKNPLGTKESTALIVTTKANNLMKDIHDRMPVIIRTKDIPVWLSKTTDQHIIEQMMAPYDSELMHAYPVTERVGHSGFKDPACIVELAKKDL